MGSRGNSEIRAVGLVETKTGAAARFDAAQNTRQGNVV